MTRSFHVLVIPMSAQGHLNPMVEFSKSLVAKGLNITVVAISSTEIMLQNGSSLIGVELIPDGSEDAENKDRIDAYLKRFKVAVSQSLSKLVEEKASSGCPVKVIVYVTQCCLGYQGKLELSSEEPSVSIPCMPPMGLRDLPSFIYEKDAHPAILRFLLEQTLAFEKADWLLFNTFLALERKVVQWMLNDSPIKTIGPCIPSIYLDKRLSDDRDYGSSLLNTNKEECMKWLDSKDTGSVVYVSFGSIASLGEEQMSELAQGLQKSNYNFLWVVGASEGSKLPSDFITNTCEKGLAVNWCSQFEVLAHQAVGCFMSHCGWNSTLESMSLGVPMLAVPQFSDQTTNAKFIVDVWEVGMRVKARKNGIVRSEEVANCIQEMMAGERGITLKENAQRWKQLAKEASDDGGSSDKDIKEFVFELCGQPN